MRDRTARPEAARVKPGRGLAGAGVVAGAAGAARRWCVGSRAHAGSPDPRESGSGSRVRVRAAGGFGAEVAEPRRWDDRDARRRRRTDDRALARRDALEPYVGEAVRRASEGRIPCRRVRPPRSRRFRARFQWLLDRQPGRRRPDRRGCPRDPRRGDRRALDGWDRGAGLRHPPPGTRERAPAAGSSCSRRSTGSASARCVASSGCSGSSPSGSPISAPCCGDAIWVSCSLGSVSARIPSPATWSSPVR